MLARCYRPLNLIETPILFTALETAELIKYATNAFLATKITFINEVADLCERVGADVQQVGQGHGPRRPHRQEVPACRPGLRRLLLPQGHPGAAAHRRAAQHATCGSSRRWSASTRAASGAWSRRSPRPAAARSRGKTIAVLGVTFKPDTDDMRESPSLVIVPALQGEGATVRAFDPEGMREAGKLLPDVHWCQDAYDALEGADAAVILTEWNEFRGLDLERAREVMRAPLADRPAQHLRPGRRSRPPASTTPASAGRRRRPSRAALPLRSRPACPDRRTRFHPTLLREYDIRGIVGEHAACGRRARASARPSAPWCVAPAARRVVPGLRRPAELARAGRRHRRGLRRGRARGAADRPRADADDVLRGASPGGRRRAADHRLAQPAGLQRLQDDAGHEAVLRRPDPGDRPDRRQRAPTPRATAGERPRSTCSTAYVDRLAADYHGTRPLCGGLGRRQRCRRPGHGGPGRPAARPPQAACSPRSTATFPTTIPIPTEPHNLEDLIREVVDRRLRARHRLRRRRRPDRRGRRPGPDRVRRPDPADPGRRRAGAPPRRHDHRRRQDQPDLLRRGRAAGRRALDVEDRPFADQGQDGRGRRAAVGRDVGPHLLQGRLLRPRRRALRRRAPARHPGPRRRGP